MTPADIKNKVLQGGKLAIERLLEKKRISNSYIVISQNGKVVKVYANTLNKSTSANMGFAKVGLKN